ncbi:MAG: M81 family metallopeptidase, partial [Devosia sp.]|nr:M81 family metallopeptidase [Devosia sp.]
MTKTVLLAGLFHETHTFLSQTTGIGAFRETALHIGLDIIGRNLGNGSPTDGFLEYARLKRWELVPSIQMAAMPGGVVEDVAPALFRRHLFASIEASGDQLDGIFLVLHGAMVSQTCDDVEGVLLGELHDLLETRGLRVPVVAVLDLHANVSQAMIDFTSCVCAYRENPHNDARRAAMRAAGLLDALMDDPHVAQVHLATRYVLPPTGTGSADNPMHAVLAAARAIEAADPDILCINVMAGYAYADIADCGFSLNCSTRGDAQTAVRYLEQLRWVLEEHITEGYPGEAVLAEVLARVDALPPGKGPVLLVEPADNIGAGTPGDATDVLGPLLATGRRNIVAVINDPQAVKACVAAGLGSDVSLSIGGKTDRHHGAPVDFSGSVQRLSDGRFELENQKSHLASMLGTHAEMGPCAVVVNPQATV